MGLGMDDQDLMQGFLDAASMVGNPGAGPSATEGPSLGETDRVSWEMIGLGLNEPLSPQEMIDDM